jgi:hypothetical protein
MSNQERVWMKEQEKEQEARKTELLRKQMQEEREMEELRKMKGDSSGGGRLAWMYQAPISTTDSDEYLMGKPKEADEVQDDQLKKVSPLDSLSPTSYVLCHAILAKGLLLWGADPRCTVGRRW